MLLLHIKCYFRETFNFKLICHKSYFAIVLCHQFILDFLRFEIDYLIRNKLVVNCSRYSSRYRWSSNYQLM